MSSARELRQRLRPVAAGLPLRERCHMAVRARSFPLHTVCDQVPPSGRILEIGCGHGVVAASLALQSPTREITGTDIDPTKLHWAHRVAAAVTAAGGSMALLPVTAAAVPPGPWDGVVLADVAYLLPAEGQRELLAAAVEQLRPGGVLVLKEVERRRGLKFAFARFEESLATRVLGITAGSSLHWRSGQEWHDLLTALGLTVRVTRIDRHLPHPHLLLTGSSCPR